MKANNIDSYIIREWIRAFVGALVVLLLLLTIANLISGFLRGNVTPLEVISNYAIELPTHVTMILPVSCLIASLFSANRLKDRNELTAIFASGFSRNKYILTVLKVAIAVAVFQLLLGAYVQPYMKRMKDFLIEDSDSKFRNLEEQGLKASTIRSGKTWYKSGKGSYFFSFIAYDKFNQVLKNVEFFEFDTNGLLSRKIYGDSAYFSKAKGWILLNGWNATRLSGESFPELDKVSDFPIPVKETPESFEEIESDITTLGLESLYEYIRRLDRSGINTNEYKVLFLSKFSGAVLCIIFSLLSLTTIFNPNRRTSSNAKNIIGVFVFTLVYWLINSSAIELGKSSKIDPYTATFAFPVLFLLFLFRYYAVNQKLR